MIEFYYRSHIFDRNLYTWHKGEWRFKNYSGFWNKTAFSNFKDFKLLFIFEE